VALAEAAWSPKGEKDWDDFKARCTAWIKRQPEAEQKGLQERLDVAYIGNRVGYWKPAGVSTELKERSWLATRYITSPGNYEIVFGYTSGAHGLAIAEVRLDPDGSTDQHEGFTGAAQRDNVYKVTLAKYDPAAKYFIKAKVRSDGGTDSNGTVYLRKVK
jgi:hexosaminidase